MTEVPVFIVVTGQKTGVKVRININNITKYRENDGGGTSFFTFKDDGSPYMVAKEKISEVDKIIDAAVEKTLRALQPDPYTLAP